MPLYHTEQEVFDLVLEGVRKQGGLSVNGSMCAYRSKEGKRCAIGLLIPDDHYTPDMEGTTYFFMVDLHYNTNCREAMGEEHLLCRDHYLAIRSLFAHEISDEFLIQMQKAHDRALGGRSAYKDETMDWFEMNMELEARQFGLVYTPPKGE